MTMKFEVKIFEVPKCSNTTLSRYYARWCKNCYIADSVSCILHTDDGTTEFMCGSRTIDRCIGEAEMHLLNYEWGYAELFDGRYRIATVTKRYSDTTTDSSLTNYGTKCKINEYI